MHNVFRNKLLAITYPENDSYLETIGFPNECHQNVANHSFYKEDNNENIMA